MQYFEVKLKNGEIYENVILVNYLNEIAELCIGFNRVMKRTKVFTNLIETINKQDSYHAKKYKVF